MPPVTRDVRGALHAALSRLADPADEARRSFVSIDPERASRLAGSEPLARSAEGPLSSFVVSIKDLFDVEGEVTTAGSRAREGTPRAVRSAPAVQRIVDAGGVLLGRTTMTELAYSGVGLNPHHGTPKNPFDRDVGRIPGGSSAGAAVSVADGICDLAIGTDTGGSIRIPAALCGLFGLKPTARRVPREGVVPLSTSLDSVGPMAASLEVISLTDAVLAGDPDPRAAVARDRRTTLRGVALALPDRYVLDDLDEHVSRVFEASLRSLTDRGAKVVETRMPFLDDLVTLQQDGGIAAYEASRAHASLIEKHRAVMDPRVLRRLERGAAISDAHYRDLLRGRAAFVAAFSRALEGVDALVMPTVPIVAPRFDEVATDEGFWRVNRLLLRNPSVINMADGCAITLPCSGRGEAPVGLTLAAPAMADRALIALAFAATAQA